MNVVFLIIIFFSLIVSTLTCIWILKIKENKWLGTLVAFIINTSILSIATVLLYKLDVQTFHKQTEGLFGSLGILVLVFFIPILSFINYAILEFVRNRDVNKKN
ncbi:MAG: hypothetical protein KGZ96_13490 [Clostridia bacterium]|nr:hypothetical protein [Clostridia bacterium]